MVDETRNWYLTVSLGYSPSKHSLHPNNLNLFLNKKTFISKMK